MSELKTPVEIDTALAELYRQESDLEFQVDRYRRLAVSYADKPYYANRVAEYDAKARELVLEISEVKKKIAELDKKYTGWSRAFLVSNSNGHIHASTNCSTCFPTTQYIWLTDLSGQDRLEIAGLAGEKACSVCYPDAPSEYFLRKCQLEDPAVVKARVEREAKRAEREAKRIASGISNPDGSALKVRSYSNYVEHLRTERTAQIWAVEALTFVLGFDEKEQAHQSERKANHEEDVDKVIIALAFKRGESVESVREQITAKANLKVRQNQKALEEWRKNNPQYCS